MVNLPPRSSNIKKEAKENIAQLPPPDTSFFGWLGQKLPQQAKFIQEKAMPTVAKILENPIFAPMVAADWAADNFIRRPLIATPLGTLQNLTATGEFDPVGVYKQTSREELPGLSLNMGQSFSTIVGQRLITRNPIIGGIVRQAELDDDLYKYVPYLNPDFDIMDPQQRKQAYLDSFYGSLTTGTADVALELLIGRGFGAGLKALRSATGFSRKPDPVVEKNLEAEVVVGLREWENQGRPMAPGQYKEPNGISFWIQDIVVKKNPIELIENPILSRSPHLTELAATIDDWETAAAFALAARGNARAALSLKEASPAIADSLEAELFPQPLKPLTTIEELADFSSMSDADKISNIAARFEDLVSRDPALQTLVDDLSYTAMRGQSLNPTWAPSKFGGVEKVKNFFNKTKVIRYQAATGPAIEEVMVGGGIFRPILSLHQRGLNWKPLGHISLTGSFARDIYDETAAVLSDSTYIKQLERDPLTRPLVAQLREDTYRSINLAVDESSKKVAADNFTRQAMILITKQRAIELGYDDVNIDPTPMINTILAKRDMAVKTAGDTGYVADDFFVDVHVGSNLKSKLPDSVILPDLNVFKKMLDDEMAARRPLIDRVKGFGPNAGRSLQLTGENINSFFSAAVLIRPGYIPKNSIFEPAMRYMMETGNLFDLSLLLPAVTNSLKNNTGRINALTDGVSNLLIPSRKKATQRVRQERLELVKQRSKIFKSDVAPLNRQIKTEIQIREDLRKNPFGYPEKMHAAQMKKSGDKIQALMKAREELNQKINIFDVAISELSQKLPRAVAAEIRGRKRSVLDRPQSIMTTKGVENYRAFSADGGSYYAQEMGDATTSLVNAVGFAGMTRRQKALGGYRSPEPGTTAYWRELESEIERFSKADPAGRGVLEGKTVGQVADDYYKGFEELGTRSPLYRLVVGKRGAEFEAGSPSLDEIIVTQADARFFAQKAFEFADLFLADPAIRASALTRKVKWKELRERFNDYYETLPPLQPIFYPADATKVEKVINVATGVQREAFKLLVGPEVKLFRYQLADNAYQEGLKIMTEFAIDQGKDLTFATMRDIENSARKYAVQKVTQTFYQVRRMNNYQYYSKFLLGFPTAMYNSLKFYAIMGLANPYNYAILEQLRTSPWAVGTVVNEENQMVNEKGFLIDDGGNYVDEFGNKSDEPVENKGETYLLFPSYSAFIKMARGEQPTKQVEPFVKKLNTRQVNFLVAGPSPVWFTQVGLKKVIASFPSLETTLKDALTERGYGNLIFEGRVGPGFGSPAEEAIGFFTNFVPKTIQRLYTLAESGKDDLLTVENNALAFQTGPVATILNVIHNARVANKAMSNPEDTEEPDLETTFKMGYQELTKRVLETAFSPLGFTYQPQSQIAQDQKAKLVRYYTTYPEHAGGLSPEDAAIFQLTALYGDSVLATMGFLTGGTKSEVGLDYSQEVATRLQKAASSGFLSRVVSENKDRIKSLPIILEPTIPGEFSPSAYSYITAFNKSGIKLKGIPRDFYDIRAEAQRKAGWYEHAKLQNKINSLLMGRPSNNINAASNADILEISRNRKAELAKLYPAWGEESGGSTAVPRFKSNLAVIDAALEDDGFMKGLTGEDKVKWKYIEAWYVEYESLIDAYTTSSDKVFRKNMRDYWSDRTMQLIQANTYFADFHSRWLTGDQIIDTSQLTAEASFAPTQEAQKSQQGPNPNTLDRLLSITGGN
jgi:hypothetical protein